MYLSRQATRGAGGGGGGGGGAGFLSRYPSDLASSRRKQTFAPLEILTPPPFSPRLLAAVTSLLFRPTNLLPWSFQDHTAD